MRCNSRALRGLRGLSIGGVPLSYPTIYRQFIALNKMGRGIIFCRSVHELPCPAASAHC